MGRFPWGTLKTVVLAGLFLHISATRRESGQNGRDLYRTINNEEENKGLKKALFADDFKDNPHHLSTKVNTYHDSWQPSQGQGQGQGQGQRLSSSRSLLKRHPVERSLADKMNADISDMSLPEEACNSEAVISCEKGTVTSLGYPQTYPPNITCQWSIIGSEKQVVHLHFEDLSLADGDCLEISYRGSHVQYLYEPAAVLCGDLRPRKFTSVGHRVDVRLTTDGVKKGRGFLLHYNIRNPVICEDLIELHGYAGSISSRNYPRAYQAHSNCTWRIVTPENRKVRVVFEDIAIEQARSCEYDALTLYDGAVTSQPKIGTFCGYRLPRDVITSGNVLLAVFTSDNTSEDSGFKLRWLAEKG